MKRIVYISVMVFLMLALVAYIAWPFLYDLVDIRLLVIAVVVGVFVQAVLSFFVRISYKKILEERGAIFTVVAIYIFCVTIFYALVSILFSVFSSL